MECVFDMFGEGADIRTLHTAVTDRLSLTHSQSSQTPLSKPAGPPFLPVAVAYRPRWVSSLSS